MDDAALKYDDLKGNNKWQTWTSQTIKRSYAERELMNIAFDRQDRLLVNNAWRTGLLPTGECVVVHGPGVADEAYLVLWNCGSVVWCGPAASASFNAS